MNWSSNSHPISDVRDWFKSKKLEIRPDFQRNLVWSKAAKIMLIDTIIKDIPMPKFYLESRIMGESTYRVVIDGQQRLSTIIEFLSDMFAMPADYDDPKWAGIKFSKLDRPEKNKFLSYILDFNFLSDPTEEEVRELYSRVNKYTFPLNKQELRKCDYPGDFIKLAEEMVQHSFFEEARVFTAAMTRRMLDVEFVEELLMILMEGMQDKKKNIDDFCEKYKTIPNYSEIQRLFIQIINDIVRLFGDIDISKTRFKQRTDLYTLFAVISSFHKEGKHLVEELTQYRAKLEYLDQNVKPLSEDENLREYAIRCTSDANSFASRNWRYEFLKRQLEGAYER